LQVRIGLASLLVVVSLVVGLSVNRFGSVVAFLAEAHLNDEAPEDRGTALTEAVLSIDQNTGLLNALLATMVSPLLIEHGQMGHHGIWIETLSVCLSWGTFFLLLNSVVSVIIHATGLMLAGKPKDKEVYAQTNMIFTGFVRH
jgi:hypothetical protein